MLSDLRIVNLALVERETLRFGPGLNVLTGETGAGKSVIVGSINLALGMRASSDMIRTGADSAYVEATFQVGCDSPPWKLSEKLELTGDNRGEIALAREISRSGKNVCRVNGIRVTLAQLREIGDLLVDIHGQHEHQSLLSRSVQREVLDEYTGTPWFRCLTKSHAFTGNTFDSLSSRLISNRLSATGPRGRTCSDSRWER